MSKKINIKTYLQDLDLKDLCHRCLESRYDSCTLSVEVFDENKRSVGKIEIDVRREDW